MKILLILKGILIGICKVIPGVSGSVIAIFMGIYDKAIDCISNFFDDFYNNLLFLVNVGIGVIIGIVFFSKILLILFDNYYVYVMMLFIGLIMGGCISIYKCSDRNRCGYFYLVLGFVIMGLFSSFSGDSQYIAKGGIIDFFVYFLGGILEGFGTVIPGISSTALLMIMGIYSRYLDVIANILNISYVFDNLLFLVSFSLGLFISIIKLYINNLNFGILSD